MTTIIGQERFHPVFGSGKIIDVKASFSVSKGWRKFYFVEFSNIPKKYRKSLRWVLASELSEKDLYDDGTDNWL